jgi:hypothetical protein
LKRTVLTALLLCGLASFLSCGSSYSSTTPPPSSHRAFISNLTSSRIDVADTSRDLLYNAISGDFPGLLVLSNDKKFTVALSPVDNSIGLLNNSQSAPLAQSALAGPSQSLVISVDDNTILAAVPAEAVFGQSPGAVDYLTVTTTTVGTSTTTTITRQPSIPLPGVHFLAASPNGNRVVAMSDAVTNPANPGDPLGRVWILQTSLVGGNTQPYQEVVSPVFDHPIFAIVTADNSTAYVVNCGPECGGTQASIVKIDMSNAAPNPPVVVGSPLPIPSGATVAFLGGNTLYVAGSAAGIGTLTTVDLGAFAVTNSVAIANGFHDRMTLGANNLLFVGALGCTITRLPAGPNPDPLQGTGCLTLFDTVKLKASIVPPTPFTPPAPDPGDDVTGMAAIPNQNEVYVAQGGELIIYDTTTGLRKIQNTPPEVVGKAVDVVAFDF